MGKVKGAATRGPGVSWLGSAPQARVFSGFQYLTPPLSVAVELALSAAEAVARLVLRAGRRPPGGGENTKAQRPAQGRRRRCLTETASNPARRSVRRTISLSSRPEDPDNATRFDSRASSMRPSKRTGDRWHSI